MLRSDPRPFPGRIRNHANNYATKQRVNLALLDQWDGESDYIPRRNFSNVHSKREKNRVSDPGILLGSGYFFLKLGSISNSREKIFVFLSERI